MFHKYQLRRASATSGSRSPSTRPQSLGRGTTSGPSSAASSPAFPTGALLGLPLPGTAPRAGHSLPRNTSDISSLDDPIITGVRRQREADDPENDPTSLSPQRVKRLKIYAKKLCSDLQIPDTSVMQFVETADLFSMLVDLKTSLVKYELTNKNGELQALQDAISSKDFEASLHSRLLACMLSPNLTAYVTDTQRHIMEFIVQHLEIFKIPAVIFDDVELRASLGKLVTRLLSTIRSQIKTQLTTSIVKRTCIIDVTRSLARSSSGMEVEAPHWARMAFIRRCLRLFLIGVSDYKIVTVQDCFTPRIIPSLKVDMRNKLEKELKIDISQLERTLPDAGLVAQDEPKDGEGSAHVDDGQPIPGAWQTGGMDDLDADADGIPDPDGGDGPDDLDETDSGFGLEGKRTRFTPQRFWNYVDYMLNLLRETVHKDTDSKEEWDEAIAGVIILILQDDLAESPGNLKKSGKVLAATNPQWQITIQEGLTW